MITMKTLIATMVSAAAIAAASASEFDANAFLGRVEKVSRSTSQKELESLVKVAEENGKAVAEAVARRLTDKSAKEDDKVNQVRVDSRFRETGVVRARAFGCRQGRESDLDALPCDLAGPDDHWR